MFGTKENPSMPSYSVQSQVTTMIESYG